MEKEAVAALHRTMRVLREELEEREATIRRLRRRRKVAKKRNSVCLFTFEDAGSEQHQRLVRRKFNICLRLLTLFPPAIKFPIFRNFLKLDDRLNSSWKVRSICYLSSKRVLAHLVILSLLETNSETLRVSLLVVAN